MKVLLVTLLCLLSMHSEAASNSKLLKYVAYREARGESVETIRAVLDVVNNRARMNNETIVETIYKPFQFPYMKRGTRLYFKKMYYYRC